MALAKGISRVRCGPLTLHTETAIDIAQKLTGVKTIFLFKQHFVLAIDRV